MGEQHLLRELHEAYVWKVNAAVAEGRMDLVWELADEHTDEALQLMSTLGSPGCGRPGCAACNGGAPRPTPPPRRRAFWRGRRR
ncbi:MAG: hypothetical protein ACJ715_02935 [Ornithinibacter sp.]